MTERDIAGLIEHLKQQAQIPHTVSSAAVYQKQTGEVMVFASSQLLLKAAAALTALQQEREQIEARVWEEAAKVADQFEQYTIERGKEDSCSLDMAVTSGALIACRNIAQALRSRASAARNEGGEG